MVPYRRAESIGDVMIIGTLAPFMGQGGVVITPYYTDGVENVAWVKGRDTNDGEQIITKAEKQAGNLYLLAQQSDGKPEIAYVTDALVDLTGINTLYIDWENTGSAINHYSYFIASTNKTGDRATFNARFINNFKFVRSVSSLDVGALMGNYYIRMHVKDNDATATAKSELKIYRIWGEA